MGLLFVRGVVSREVEQGEAAFVEGPVAVAVGVVAVKRRDAYAIMQSIARVRRS